MQTAVHVKCWLTAEAGTLLEPFATKLTWHWVVAPITKGAAPGRGGPLHFGSLTPALCLIGEVGCKIFHLGIGVRATPLNSKTNYLMEDKLFNFLTNK